MRTKARHANRSPEPQPTLNRRRTLPVSVPDDVFDWATGMASEEGISVTDVVRRELIRAHRRAVSTPAEPEPAPT